MSVQRPSAQTQRPGRGPLSSHVAAVSGLPTHACGKQASSQPQSVSEEQKVVENDGGAGGGATTFASVAAHAAWHHLAAKAVGASPPAAMFLGESIASAFDLYLVGRLMGHASDSEFLATQVPAMSDAAAGAGVDEDAFEALLHGVTEDP